MGRLPHLGNAKQDHLVCYTVLSMVSHTVAMVMGRPRMKEALYFAVFFHLFHVYFLCQFGDNVGHIIAIPVVYDAR